MSIRSALGRPLRIAGRVRERLAWARRIAAADLVDTAYVGAQLGRPVSARSAILRYVWRGYQQGLRLNPLFVDVAVGDHLPGTNRVPALVAYLDADPRRVQVSPIWDAAAYLDRFPDRADEPGGAVGAAWRGADGPLPARPGNVAPADASVIRTVAAEAAADVRSGRRRDIAATETRDVELIVTLRDGETDFDETLAELSAFAAAGDAVAIGVTSRDPEVWAQTALLALSPTIRAALRVDAEPDAVRAELLATSSAATVVLRDPDVTMSAADVRELVASAAPDTLVAPVWLDADGTIAAAGAAAEGLLLSGHPAEDAAGLGHGPVQVPALVSPVLAARREDLSLSGDDLAGPDGVRLLRTDLAARSRAAAAPRRPRGDAGYAADLLTAAGWDDLGTGRLRHPARRTTLEDGTDVPVLRWALKTAAPVGERGEWWGDTHFARGLADALRRLGQEVVIDAYPARDRRTAYLDDVTVALRGPERIDAPASGTSILWIISHPDEIDAEALAGFDHVFAASTPWAAVASRRFGRAIRPLLQCTDTTRFRPSGAPRTDDIVFVGTARGIRRPSVVDPVEAGIPVRVYGPDWREWIPASAISGTGVPNAELPAMYEAAGVVLNDHWPGMQRAGFIANRPYDVVAAGGRVISDRVEGIEDVFGGAVVTYRTTDELITLLRGDLDAVFPGEEALAAIAERIRREDSFDARARVLLETVLTNATLSASE